MCNERRFSLCSPEICQAADGQLKSLGLALRGRASEPVETSPAPRAYLDGVERIHSVGENLWSNGPPSTDMLQELYNTWKVKLSFPRQLSEAKQVFGQRGALKLCRRVGNAFCDEEPRPTAS